MFVLFGSLFRWGIVFVVVVGFIVGEPTSSFFVRSSTSSSFWIRSGKDSPLQPFPQLIRKKGENREKN
jgi:hypothetical protein